MPKDNHSDCVLKCTCNSSSYTSLKSPKSHNGDNKIMRISKISCDAATSPNRHSQKSPQNNMRLINNKGSSSPKYNELCISDDKKILNKSVSPRRLVQTRNAATSPNLDIRKQLSPKQTQQYQQHQQQLQHHQKQLHHHQQQQQQQKQQQLQKLQQHQFQQWQQKQHCNELLPKSPDLSSKLLLEKSNSLGETKPTRPLRTTRSLSPRPPVRHQHAIMVSDENDIMTVKISPNEEYDDECNENKSSPIMKNVIKERYKAQSEQTSPNLSDFDTTFIYDCSVNNKSTGCLVYIPSDPWLKMSDIDAKYNIINDSSAISGSDKKKYSKLSKETRSLSRGNLPHFDNDPWVWRKSSDTNSVTVSNVASVIGGGFTSANSSNFSNNNKIKSPKQDIYQQRKSFSTTKFEISSTDCLSGKSSKTLLLDSSCSKNSNQQQRPKLQRSKSPIILDDDTYMTEKLLASCTCNKIITEKNSNLLLSPRKENLEEMFISSSISQSPPTTSTAVIVPSSSSSSAAAATNKAFLNVINPNLMQSRHSFSSISQKDDELQLNIRRLSEQIKHCATSASGADFTDYLSQFRNSNDRRPNANVSTSTAVVTRNSSKNSDPVLETTC